MFRRHPRRLALACVLSVALFSVAPTGAKQAPAPGDANRPETVEERLQRCLKDNDRLRTRVKQLEQEVETLKRSRTINLTPQPATPAVPPTWQPFQFNGATYYMVPLDASGKTQSAQLLTDAESNDTPAKAVRP
jgi:hypothetical protein